MLPDHWSMPARSTYRPQPCTDRALTPSKLPAMRLMQAWSLSCFAGNCTTTVQTLALPRLGAIARRGTTAASALARQVAHSLALIDVRSFVYRTHADLVLANKGLAHTTGHHQAKRHCGKPCQRPSGREAVKLAPSHTSVVARCRKHNLQAITTLAGDAHAAAPAQAASHRCEQRG